MEKTKLGITRFFSGLFRNFHKLLLTNLLFAVPLVLFGLLFHYINIWTGLNTSFITFLPIIFVFPFFAGVTIVTRNIVRGDEDVKVVKPFFKAVKDNLVCFIIHGIILYLAIFFCYSSITLYWKLAESNGIFYMAFGIAVIIAVAMLFIFYNVPVMTVTFDLSLKNIYKNSALLSFGELKNNFFATLGLFLLFIFCATVFFTAPNATALVVVMIALSVLLAPSVASYIMNFYIYKDMEAVIMNSDEKAARLRREIEAKKAAQKQEDEKLDFSSLDLDESKDPEEYLYFNGKMIKRKVLIEMKKEAENEQKEEEKA